MFTNEEIFGKFFIPFNINELNLRQKRDEYTDEIKRRKREEIIKNGRLRNIGPDQGKQVESAQPVKEDDELLPDLIKQWENQSFENEKIVDLVDLVFSEDKLLQHYGLIGVHKYADRDENLIQPLIDYGLVPRLIAYMKNDDEPYFQKVATNLIKFLACGTTCQTKVLIDQGVLPRLFNIIQSNSTETLKYAFWTLGNIAGDCPSFRDLILEAHGLEYMTEAVDKCSDQETIKLGTWAISNLCRGKPLPPAQLVEIAIPTLSTVIQKTEDQDILTDALRALAYISRGLSQAEKIFATGLVPRLIDCLGSTHDPLIVPCARILADMFIYKTRISISDCGSKLIPKLFKVAQSPLTDLKREAFYAISHITERDMESVNTIINNPYYIDIIIKATSLDVFEISLWAVWALFGAIKSMQQNQVTELVELGVLDCFINLLGQKDEKLLSVVLDGIEKILNWGALLALETKGENEFLILLEDRGGVKKLEDLQTHPCKKVYRKVVKIFKTFYDIQEFI